MAFDFKKIFEKLLTPKGTKTLMFAGLAGIALIFISSFIPFGNSKPSAVPSAAASQKPDATASLENKLEKLISDIDGVGKAEIMITFKSGTQYVYEQDQKQTVDKTSQTQGDGGHQVTENTNEELQPVIINGDSGVQQALIKTELTPEVKGVVVICDGGNNPTVQENIVNAVSTALDLPSNHVCVIKKS